MISLRRPVKDIEQERFQDFRRIAPACKVECLESAERKRVLGIVKEKSILAAARPPVQAVLQLPDNVG